MLQYLHKRISNVVSMDPKAETSISNFGTGGDYVPHADRNNTWWGELSSTEGGALVFPSAKINLHPTFGMSIKELLQAMMPMTGQVIFSY